MFKVLGVIIWIGNRVRTVDGKLAEIVSAASSWSSHVRDWNGAAGRKNSFQAIYFSRTFLSTPEVPTM